MKRGKRSPLIFLVLTLLLVACFSLIPLGRTPHAAETESPYRDIRLFTDVLSIVRKSYVEEVDIKDLVYGAINGMLSSLDPHSGFMPPEMYKEMKIDTKGEFGGLGIEITIKDDVLSIVSPIEDTPAYRAGLKAGDQIVKIGDRYTKDMGVMEAVNLMRGPAGTEVTISVMRDSFEMPKEYKIVREIIKIKSVKYRTLQDGYAYVRLTQFQERSSDDLREALDVLRKDNDGALSGLILDLRNNPGGLLDQAVMIADTFLYNGLIVYTEGREEGSQMKFDAGPDGTEPAYPMVVLINGGSASASEIVAGALQDQGRAIVLGTQSFGKGSVQTIIPLSDDSGLRLTTARYFTPNGTSIQARGIVPDIIVHQMTVQDNDDGVHFREKDLRNHIETSDIPETLEPSDGEGRHFNLEDEDRGDYQMMRALDLLKGWRIFKGLDRPAA